MRLSDLLGAEVLDEAGRSAGRVHDVRLVQDGPVVGGFGAALRLDGLLVGRRAVGARLGYDRGKMKGRYRSSCWPAGCSTTAGTSNGADPDDRARPHPHLRHSGGPTTPRTIELTSPPAGRRRRDLG
jgi:hypothetical protein